MVKNLFVNNRTWRYIFLCLGWLFFASQTMGMTRQIAITIDDLPFVGDEPVFHLNKIIDSIQQCHIPVTGFVIGQSVRPNNLPVLERFRAVGLSLGNHTYSHADLNRWSSEDYIADIDKTDEILRPLLSQPKYFRYPYLAMSQGEKKEAVLHHLEQQGYHIAPITIDSKDFVFNQQLYSVPEVDRRNFLNELKPVYLDYLLIQTQDAETRNLFNHQPDKAQILLIHANLLNAYVLEDIIKLYQHLGYKFISLQDALSTFNTSPSSENLQQSKVTQSTAQQTKSDLSALDVKIDKFVEWD